MSDFDNQKRMQEQRELIELKKQKAKGIGAIQSTPARTKQLTKQQKWDNFWDYHLKTVVLSIIGVVLAVHFIVSIFNQPQYDHVVICATSVMRQSDVDPFRIAFAQYASDTDENGEVAIDMVAATLITQEHFNQTDVAKQEVMSGVEKLLAEIIMGENGIFVLDDVGYHSVYTQCGQEDIFVDLSKLYPEHPQITGSRFYIKGTPFEQALGISDLPADFSISIRALEQYEDMQAVQQRYEHEMKLLERLIDESW